MLHVSIHTRFAAALAVCLLAACAGSSGEDPPIDLPPSVTVAAPAQALSVTAGSRVAIEYADADLDSVATSDVVAVGGGTPIVIAQGRAEQDGAAQNLMWDTSTVPPGTYRIVVRTTDGVTTVEDTAPGAVTVRVPPTLELIDPARSVRVDRGDIVPVVFRLEDADSIAIAELFVDRDNAPSSLPLASFPEGTNTYDWDTAGLHAGAYRIRLVGRDGDHPDVVIVSSPVIVDVPVDADLLGHCLLDLELVLAGYDRLFQTVSGIPNNGVSFKFGTKLVVPLQFSFEYEFVVDIAPRATYTCYVFAEPFSVARPSLGALEADVPWQIECRGAVSRIPPIDGGAGVFRFRDIRQLANGRFAYRVATVDRNVFLLGGCAIDFEIAELIYDESGYPTGSIGFEATVGGDTVRGTVHFDGSRTAEVVLDGFTNPDRFLLDLDARSVSSR